MMCISWARALLVMVSFVGICTNALSLEAALGNLHKDLDAFAAKIDEGKPSSLKSIAKSQELTGQEKEIILTLESMLLRLQKIEKQSEITGQMLVRAYPTKDELLWGDVYVFSDDIKEKVGNALKNNLTGLSEDIQERSKKVSELGNRIWTTRIQSYVKK